MTKFNLDGKRALITGGSRGIGFGIAREMAQAGADLVLVARDPARLRQARDELEDTGRSIGIRSFDLEDVEGIAALYAELLDAYGPIDILVNSAGLTRRGPAHQLSLDDWNLVITVNLTAVFALCQAFGRERISSGSRGKIINIASLMSDAARQDNSPYAASKGGIRQLTKALAVDWARYGINVNAIGPGYIHTDLTRSLWEDAEFDQWVKARTPMGRWGTPEDIAATAVFLASEAADFITGQLIYVDGGWLATF